MTFTAGEKIRAATLNQMGAVVGRNRRTTNSTAVSAATRILSVIAPVFTGRTYRVLVHGEIFANAAANVSQSELRYTTDNTEPLTSSTLLARGLKYHTLNGIPDEITIVGEFVCTSNATLRVAVVTARVVGASTVAWSADATFPMHIKIEDLGTTVSTTGTVY